MVAQVSSCNSDWTERNTHPTALFVPFPTDDQSVSDYSILSNSTGSTMNSNALIVSIARRIVGPTLVER
jgi:hypothetical protein